MRWVHMALICVFAAVVIIFAVQNLQLVTHATSVSMPGCRSRFWLQASICWAP